MLSIFTSSDAAIVRQVLSGQRDRFALLVQRHIGTVYAVAYSHSRNHADAEDITQETFLKAFTSLDALREPKKFGGWISVIARNAAQTLMKKQSRESAVTAAAAPTAETESPDPSRGELHSVLREALDNLDQSTREILMLQYFAGKNARQIADALGITHAAARKRLQRARETLSRDLLGEFQDALTPRRPLADQSKTIMQAILTAAATWNLAGIAAGASALIAWGLSKLSATALSATAVVVGSAWWLTQDNDDASQVNPPQQPILVAANPPEPIAPEIIKEETPTPEPPAQPEPVEDPEDPPKIRRVLHEQPNPDMREMLARNVTIVFEGIEITDILEFLSETYKVPLLIDDRAVTIPEYVVVTGDEEEQPGPANTSYATDGVLELIEYQDITMEEFLNEMCAALGLAYWPEPSYVWISTADRIRMELQPRPRSDYENSRIEETLARKTTVVFEDIHINDILQFITETYNLNIVVDQRVVAPEPEPGSGRPRVKAVLASEGGSSNTMLEFISLKSVTLSETLTVMLRQLNLAYVILGNDIVLSSPALIASGEFPEENLITIEAFDEKIRAKKTPLVEKMLRMQPQPVDSPTAGRSGARSGVRPRPSVRLTDIQEPAPGQYRAQLKFSSGTTRWYNVGDKFEDYELLEIDAKNRCVKFSWETTSTTYKLCFE